MSMQVPSVSERTGSPVALNDRAFSLSAEALAKADLPAMALLKTHNQLIN